jgi:hypothetical protein
VSGTSSNVYRFSRIVHGTWRRDGGVVKNVSETLKNVNKTLRSISETFRNTLTKILGN